jgi:hypothetical protein
MRICSLVCWTFAPHPEYRSCLWFLRLWVIKNDLGNLLRSWLLFLRGFLIGLFELIISCLLVYILPSSVAVLTRLAAVDKHLR